MNDFWDDSRAYALGLGQYDISVLDGLRTDTRKALRRAGIDTVHQLAALSIEELRVFNGLGKVTAPQVKAHAQAFVEQQPVWMNALPACHGGFMFDLETDGLTHVPWCFGWAEGDGTLHTAVVSERHHADSVTLVDGSEAMLVPDSDALWGLFAAMTASDGCPIYHWGHYDKGVLRGTAPSDVCEQLEDRLHNLHETFKRSVKFPRPGTSLKVIAAHLDFAWSSYEDWMAAYRDYRYWLESGDIEALSRACSYQQDDVRALGLVWRWLVENAPEGESRNVSK
jgi:predicted RecB family nuclease